MTDTSTAPAGAGGFGVASTAPGYSLAATLGFVIGVVGFKAPAIMWLAFVPKLLHRSPIPVLVVPAAG